MIHFFIKFKRIVDCEIDLFYYLSYLNKNFFEEVFWTINSTNIWKNTEMYWKLKICKPIIQFSENILKCSVRWNF